MLEVGTGSGYGTAILARLAGEVVSIERYRSLADRGAGRLEAQGVAQRRDPARGRAHRPAGGMPFDRILIKASVEYPPGALLAQLRPAGRIVSAGT